MDASSLKKEEPSFAELQGTWLISFADLITLLLCAFLMFFSITWNKTKSSGIQIAELPPERQEVSALERVRELRFLKKDTELSTGRLSEEALSMIKSIVDSKAYSSGMVLASFCTEKGGNGDTSGLRSQLVDTGIDTKRTALRDAGADCELLNGGTKGDVRTIIRFERE